MFEYFIEEVTKFRKNTGLDKGQSRELHYKLMREEQSEMADALADQVYVVTGILVDGKLPERLFKAAINSLQDAAEKLEINLLESFKIVKASNDSKLCTEDEIKATQEKYAKIGVLVSFTEVSDGLFACYSDCDHPDYPRGKLLKSVSYHEPDWSGDEWLL